MRCKFGLCLTGQRMWFFSGSGLSQIWQPVSLWYISRGWQFAYGPICFEAAEVAALEAKNCFWVTICKTGLLCHFPSAIVHKKSHLSKDPQSISLINWSWHLHAKSLSSKSLTSCLTSCLITPPKLRDLTAPLHHVSSSNCFAWLPTTKQGLKHH